jgi:hypothetical protein
MHHVDSDSEETMTFGFIKQYLHDALKKCYKKILGKRSQKKLKNQKESF